MRSLKLYGRSMAAVLFASVVAIPVALACVAGTYDGITAAVDWADVITGITAIAALIAAVLVVKRGSRMLLAMIGR